MKFRCALVIAVLAFATVGRCAGDQTQAPNVGAAESQIGKLIEQLGDPQFAVRERAQQDLIKLGFDAFDALAEAESSDDPEIAMQASYLVRLIRAQWTQENDPRAIQQILKDYDLQTDDRRLARIKQLAELPGDQGLEWLCRLVRFEKSLALSKQAALAIIGQAASADHEVWTRRAATITKNLQRARRPAARWLVVYVQAHTDPAGALGKWSELVEAERKTLDEHPQETSGQIVMELLRRKIDWLDRLGRPDETAEAMHQMVLAERGDSASIMELLDWLVKRKAWSAVDEVATRFAASFELDATLMYTLCEARLAQGDRGLAEQTAEKALKLSGDNPQEHAAVVDRLVERGLVEWADRELRQIIALGPTGSPTDVRARRYLADSLHDRRRDREAAEVLELLMDAAEKDPAAMQRLRASRQQGEATNNLIRSSMFYYFACDATARSDHAKQREYLDKALDQDRTNVDVLIALYRAPEKDPEKRAQLLKLIREMVEVCRAQIDSAPDEPTYYNQVAWLVANTEGDFDEAIRFSHKSVELARAEGESPKRIGGLLDTLAHCYFAKKDYTSAIKYQSEAVRLDPHTQAIARQLAAFRESAGSGTKE